MSALLLVCLKVGFLTVGGASVMFPALAHELVDKGSWLTRDEFLYATVLCQGTPGPVMTGMGLVGYKWGSVPGALAVMACLFAPGILWMVGMGRAHQHFQRYPAMNAFFEGVRPAVPGLLAGLAFQLGFKAGFHPLPIGIMILCMVAILRFRVTPALLLLISVSASFFL